MNLIKSALRIKLNLANPYQIKPEFKMFNKPENNSIVAKLFAKTRLNSDYHILRMELPEDDKCLGLKIGQYVWLEIAGQKRPYVPISSIDESNFVDFLIRDMSQKNPNSFTSKLLSLPVLLETIKNQQKITISGPGTQFQYEGYGKIKYSDTITKEQKIKKFKNIGIITHSSAITTSYSLIQSIVMNYDSETGISLLWVGDKQSDFVFVDEFTTYVDQCKINMNLMLTTYQKGWLGPYGKLTEDYIKDYMPPPENKQMIIMSGLNGQLSDVPQLIKKMGYKDYLNF